MYDFSCATLDMSFVRLLFFISINDSNKVLAGQRSVTSSVHSLKECTNYSLSTSPYAS